MDNYYFVYLESKDGDQFHLKYLLNENEITKKFIDTTRNSLNIGAIPHGEYFSYLVSDEEYQFHLDRMREMVRYVSSHGIWIMPDYPLTIDTLTRTQLNELHRLFHRFEEYISGDLHNIPEYIRKWKSEDPITFERSYLILHELNILIHSIEHMMKSRNSLLWSFFGFHLAPQEKIPLSPEEYDQMTLDVKFGDLLLCYGSAGKSLYWTFLDDDLVVLENNEVRQQESVSTGVLAAFPCQEFCDISADYAKEQKELFYQWCDKNKVSDRGYNYKDRYYNPGNIILGRLVDCEYKFEEISNVIKKYNKVRAVEIKTSD